MLLINEPAWISLNQSSSVAGCVSFPGRGLSLDDRAGSACFDDGTATDAVAHTCDGPAIDECCACACFHGAFAMERAAMTVTYEYDGFHLRFLLLGWTVVSSKASAGGGAARTLNSRQTPYQQMATERL